MRGFPTWISMMIEFENDLIKPSYHREACYIGGATDKAVFSWVCDSCSDELYVTLGDIWEGYAWKEKMPPEQVEALTDHFNLNMVGKSHDGGWPHLIKIECDSCGRHLILYVGVS